MLDRTLLTLALTAVLACGAAWLRPYSHVSGMIPTRFWLQKMRLRQDSDVVVAGASRVLEGISPEEMTAALPGRRIANFGFGHTGFDAPFLAAIRARLDPATSDPVIALSIQPLGFTRHSTDPVYSEFHKWYTSSRRQLLADDWLAWVQHQFRPMGSKAIRDAWRGRREQGSRVFRQDGWVAAAPIPETPNRAAEIFPELFRENPLAPAMIDRLLEEVGGWRSQGIRVFGFRPPIPPWLDELEWKLSGFAYPDFIRRFEAAGGVWLAPERQGYHCYDGAHLAEESARRYSRTLAEALRAALAGPAPGAPPPP